jgi:hypothetical protein
MDSERTPETVDAAKLAALTAMRFRLRTLIIVALDFVASEVAIYRAIPYLKPMAKDAADYVEQRIARVVYRNGGNCHLTLD